MLLTLPGLFLLCHIPPSEGLFEWYLHAHVRKTSIASEHESTNKGCVLQTTFKIWFVKLAPVYSVHKGSSMLPIPTALILPEILLDGRVRRKRMKLVSFCASSTRIQKKVNFPTSNLMRMPVPGSSNTLRNCAACYHRSTHRVSLLSSSLCLPPSLLVRPVCPCACGRPPAPHRPFLALTRPRLESIRL